MPKAQLIKKVANVLPPAVFEVATSVYQFGRNVFLPTVKVPNGSLPERRVNAYYRTRKFGPRKKACYAPFNNLYFAIDGKVMACCYNRDVPLGFYPVQSIKDIWTGEEADKLRKRIEAFDLGGGCQLCKQQLLAGDYAAVMASKYDYQAEEGPQYPTRFDFELSNTCNLECVMCSGEFSSSIRKNREGKEPIISPYGDDFLMQLDEFIPHLKVANFLGGEPFLIDIYYQIWDKIIAINPNCEIRLQTNATVFNDKVKRLLEKGNFHIGISIDSFDSKVYEAIRVNANYGRVIKNIHHFAEYAQKKNTFLTLSYCPLRSNWNELPAVLNFANQLGAFLSINTVIQPAGSALWSLSSHVLTGIKNELSSFAPAMGNFFEKNNAMGFKGFIKQLDSWISMAKQREDIMAEVAHLDNDTLLQNFFTKIADTFIHLNNEDPDAYKAAMLYFKGVVTDFITSQPDAHKVLVKLNALPFEWLKNDTEIFEGNKFFNKVGAYLTE